MEANGRGFTMNKKDPKQINNNFLFCVKPVLCGAVGF